MENGHILDQLCERHPLLQKVKNSIREAAEVIIACYADGGKVMICGNGGSCSDSDHIVGELMKGFEVKRSLAKTTAEKLTGVFGERGAFIARNLQQGLPAISLTAHTSLITAISNDIDPSLIFAQQVIGYGNPGDVLIGISTSGNSQNVVDGFITAKAKGLKVIGITGETGGEMKPFCDVLINVPGKRTSFVQELQLPVYHAICMLIENHFFENQD